MSTLPGTGSDDDDDDDDFGGKLCNGKPCSDGGGDAQDENDGDDDADGKLCDGKPCSDSNGVQLSYKGGNGGAGQPVPEDTPVDEVVFQLRAPTAPDGTPVAATFVVRGTQKRRQRRATDSGDGESFTTPDVDVLAFKVDKTTGEVAVAGPLDYETKPWYNFVVVIQAGGDEEGKFLPYTAVVPLNISIAAVACPTRRWSPTGTYPCADHSPRCDAGYNETLAPTPTNDRACSKLAEAKGEDKGANAGVTAAISALLVVAAVCLVVFALLYKRNADQEKDDVDSMEEGKGGVNPMFGGNSNDGVYLAPMLAGPPGVPRSRPELAYHRVVSYDALYHGNVMLALPDVSVARIYRHFELPLPSDQELVSCRSTTQQFLDLPVVRDGMLHEGNLHDAVEFLARAMADVLVDRAIDCLVDFEAEATVDAFVAACCSDGALLREYIPTKNQFLEAVEGFTFEDLRQLIQPLGTVAGDDAVYAMAAGNASQHEYMAADGTQVSAFEMAAAGKLQATYEMAMGMPPGTATYEMAAAYSRQQNTYEMANNVGAGMADYEMANAYNQQPTSAGASMYDTGAARPESALYATATAPSGQATYAVASAALLLHANSGTGRGGREATYDMAAMQASEATYEMAAASASVNNRGSRSSSSTTSRPKSLALYALGAEAPGESNDYGTSKKLSLTGAEVEESSDGGGGRRGLPQQTYALGDSGEGEDSSTDIRPHKRSLSYGDALDTVGIVAPRSEQRDSTASGLLEPTSPERTTFEFTDGKGSRPGSGTSGAGTIAAAAAVSGLEEDDVVVDDEEDGYFELTSSATFGRQPVDILQHEGDLKVKSVRRSNPMFRNSYLPKQTSEEA